MERGLQQREQRCRAGVGRLQGHDIAPRHHEPLLVRVEGEDDCVPVLGDRTRFHAADAAVPIAKRIREGAAQRAERFVQGQVRVHLTAVGEQLRAGADSRVQRADQNLVVRRHRELDVHVADSTWRVEREGP